MFPPLDIELFRDEEPTESSPHNTRPVMAKISSPLTAQRKKVRNQKQPIELNLRFKRQKSDKSPGRPLIYDDPWEIYQELVYQNGTGDTLYERGRTAHSMFEIPVRENSSDLVSKISLFSGRAEVLRQVALIV